jgi:hypothetical protein
MNSLYAFKCKLFRNARHTATYGNTIVKLFLKHSVLPVKVKLNRNYLRQHLVYLATLRQLKTLRMSSE